MFANKSFDICFQRFTIMHDFIDMCFWLAKLTARYICKECQRTFLSTGISFIFFFFVRLKWKSKGFKIYSPYRRSESNAKDENQCLDSVIRCKFYFVFLNICVTCRAGVLGLNSLLVILIDDNQLRFIDIWRSTKRMMKNEMRQIGIHKFSSWMEEKTCSTNVLVEIAECADIAF